MNGLTKIQILFHVSPFRLVSSYGRFEEPWRLYLPGEADQEPSHTASTVTDVSKNRGAYIFRVKPTKNRPILPASVDTAQHRTGLDSSAASLWQLQKPHTLFRHLSIFIVAENPYIRAQKWLDHGLYDWQSEFDHRRGEQYTLSSEKSWPNLRPIKSPFRNASWLLCHGVKKLNDEGEHLLQLVPKLTLRGTIPPLIHTSECINA